MPQLTEELPESIVQALMMGDRCEWPCGIVVERLSDRGLFEHARQLTSAVIGCCAGHTLSHLSHGYRSHVGTADLGESVLDNGAEIGAGDHH